MITPSKSRFAWNFFGKPFAIVVYLLAAWLATTTIVYLGAPAWLAIVGWVLWSAILPLTWDAISNVRRRRAKIPPTQGFVDRMTWRTSLLNFGLAVALVLVTPTTLFAALSTRGDWIVDGQSGPVAMSVRSGTTYAATRLEALYGLATPRPDTKTAISDKGN